MKKIKVIALSLFLASIFVCTAFADTRGQGVAISANNEASGIVSCKQEVNSDINSTGILPPIIPKIETFQVKRVRVYPAYTKPDRPGYHYYYKDKYAVNTIPGNNYGQVNTLKVSPTTTEKLRHSLDDLGQEDTFI